MEKKITMVIPKENPVEIKDNIWCCFYFHQINGITPNVEEIKHI